MKKILAVAAAGFVAVAVAVGVAGATASGDDTIVTSGSPSTPFTQNKQNEPAVPGNPNHPGIAAAGPKGGIRLQACHHPAPTTRPVPGGGRAPWILFPADRGP